MQERLIEIIIFVMSMVKFTKISLPEIDYKALENLGYSQSEISAALSWIVSGVEYRDKYNIANAPSAELPFRVLTESEKEIFADEVLFELSNYVDLGIINNEQMEFIIERLDSVGIQNIDSGILKSIIAAVVFSQTLSNPQNKGLVLSGSESIN